MRQFYFICLVVACALFSSVASEPSETQCAEVIIDCDYCEVRVRTPKANMCGQTLTYAGLHQFARVRPRASLNFKLYSEVKVSPYGAAEPSIELLISGPGSIICTGNGTSREDPFLCNFALAPNKRSPPELSPSAKQLVAKIRGTLTKIKAEDINYAGIEAKLHELWYSAEMFPIRSFVEGFNEKLSKLVDENEPQLASLINWLGLPPPQEIKETAANFI